MGGKIYKITKRQIYIIHRGTEYFTLGDDTSKLDPLMPGKFLCDFFNVDPYDLEILINSLPNLDKPLNRKLVNLTFIDLYEKTKDIDTVFMNFLINFYVDKNKIIGKAESQEAIQQIYASLEPNFPDNVVSLKQFESVSLKIDNEFTIGGYYKKVFNRFLYEYLLGRALLSRTIYDDNKNNNRAILDRTLELQKINYRICDLEGELSEIFTFTDYMSLFSFELVRLDRENAKIKICKNCKSFFVDGRADAIYCSNSSPQDSTKTCREIGAQVTRANKEKSDVTVSEYRKLYLKLKMTTRRHPENKEAKVKLEYLTSNISNWRKKLSNGECTVEEYLDWLKGF